MTSSLKTLKARSYKRAFFSFYDGQYSGLSNRLLAVVSRLARRQGICLGFRDRCDAYVFGAYLIGITTREFSLANAGAYIA